MQITNRIRDITKPLQPTLNSTIILPYAQPYQVFVTNSHTNTSFSNLSNSITGTLLPMPQYLEEK